MGTRGYWGSCHGTAPPPPAPALRGLGMVAGGAESTVCCCAGDGQRLCGETPRPTAPETAAATRGAAPALVRVFTTRRPSGPFSLISHLAFDKRPFFPCSSSLPWPSYTRFSPDNTLSLFSTLAAGRGGRRRRRRWRRGGTAGQAQLARRGIQRLPQRRRQRTCMPASRRHDRTGYR